MESFKGDHHANWISLQGANAGEDSRFYFQRISFDSSDEFKLYMGDCWYPATNPGMYDCVSFLCPWVKDNDVTRKTSF